MKVLHNGKLIEVPDSHARLLVRNGRAKWPKGESAMKAEKPAKDDEVQTATTIKRAYKRRDMQSED